MSRDLSKLSLYAIVNYTAVAGTAAGETIPVAGITAANSGNFIVLYKATTTAGAGAGLLTSAKAVNTGISVTTSAGTDLSTYQFTIYQQE